MAAALGHGREIRGVGFHQDAVGGHIFGRFLNIGGVFEGDDAGKRNVKAQIKRHARHAHVFGEAVDHAGVGAAFAQHGHGVVGGIAGVHNQRQAALVGCFDVLGEAALLPGQIAFAPMVIEAGFAYAHHFGVGGMGAHFGDAEFFGVFTVGVHAHAGVDIFVRLGNGEHFFEAFAAHADGQRLRHLVCRHIGKHFGQALGEAFEIQMAM